MNFGPLAAAAAMMRRIKPTKKCERCGLRYPLNAEACPHCAGLDADALKRFKAELHREHRKTASVGKMLLSVAVLFVIALVVLNA